MKTKQLQNEASDPVADVTYIDALLADFSNLDKRLQSAIERLHNTLGDNVDTSQRGLVIDEGDVDLWLSNLRSAGVMESENATLRGATIASEGGRLAELARVFDLSRREQAIVLTALAPEFDLAYANLYSYVQDDVTKKYTTLDLINVLWSTSSADKLQMRRVIAPGARLRQNLILSVDDSPALSSPLLTRPIVLDPRIVSFLLGSDEFDPVIAASLRLVSPEVRPYTAVNPAHLDNLATLVTRTLTSRDEVFSAQTAPDKSDPPAGLVVWMRGPERLGKREAAEHLAHTLGRPLIIVESASLIASTPEPRKAMQRVMRETKLTGAVLYWANADALSLSKEQ